MTRALLDRLIGGGAVVVGAALAPGDRALRGPLYAQISVADPCNHRCVMCPYHPPGARQRDLLPQFGATAPGIMSLERFTETVEDLARLGTRRIDLVGRGEPLLNPAIVEMVAFAKRRGLEVAMTTNGSRLDEATAAGLVDAALDHLKVSLNAGRAATYPRIHVNQSESDHARVLAGVARVCARRSSTLDVTLSYTISTLNYGELDDMVDRASEVAAQAAYFQHLVPVPSRPELTLSRDELLRIERELAPRALERAARLGIETNLRSFADEASRLADGGGAGRGAVPCYAGYYFTVVLGNGQVMPCCQIERSLGSVENERFAQIWNGERYRRFRGAARRLPVWSEELETAGCSSCYFEPHNVTVHRLVRPLAAALGPGGFTMRQALRMVRLDSDRER